MNYMQVTWWTWNAHHFQWFMDVRSPWYNWALKKVTFLWVCVCSSTIADHYTLSAHLKNFFNLYKYSMCVKCSLNWSCPTVNSIISTCTTFDDNPKKWSCKNKQTKKTTFLLRIFSVLCFAFFGNHNLCVFLFEFCLLLHISHFYGVSTSPPFFFFTFWNCVLNGLDQRDRMLSTFASKKAKHVCTGIFCVYIYIYIHVLILYSC